MSALAFDETGDNLVAGSQSGSVTVWRLDDGQPAARFTHGTAVTSVAFAGSGLVEYGGPGGFAVHPWQLGDLTATRVIS